MNKIILFSIFTGLFFLKISHAQTVNWGNEAKTNRASGEPTSLGWHNGYLYDIERDQAGVILLEKLSVQMELISS